METTKRSDSARIFPFNSWRDITPLQASLGTMLHNKTGSWRFIKPIYEEKVPGCQNGCPSGNDIEGWIKLINQNEYEKAYWHLKTEQPFPAILGRVCFKFCEQACNRSTLDHGIRINALERFIGDQVPASTPYPEIPPDNGKTVTIIGSGPAGMSAAYFARRLGFRVTILEKSEYPGGLLREGIPAYRLPKEMVDEEFKGLRAMGIEIKTGTEVGKDINLEELILTTDYLFLSTGAHHSLSLDLPGAQTHPNVMSALDFLVALSHGESVTPGHDVVVIGGGNTALDAARSAVRLGCSVTVVYRRSEAEMPAHVEEVAEAGKEGVVFIFLAAPEGLAFNADNGKHQLFCSHMTLGEPDESGRRRPIKKKGEMFTLSADTVLTAIGEKPDLTYLSKNDLGEDVTIGNNGVAVDDTLKVLKQKGDGIDENRAVVYAGGDVIDGPRTVVHAVAYGKRAAIAMDCHRKNKAVSSVMDQIAIGRGGGVSFSRYKALSSIDPSMDHATDPSNAPAIDPPIHPHPRRVNLKKVVDSTMMVYDYFQTADAISLPTQPPDVRAQTFSPYQETLAREDAEAESARCMHCGRCTECNNCLVFCPDVSILVRPRSERTSPSSAPSSNEFPYEIDYDYCKGCGICAVECPRNAMTMVSETSDENALTKQTKQTEEQPGISKNQTSEGRRN